MRGSVRDVGAGLGDYGRRGLKKVGARSLRLEKAANGGGVGVGSYKIPKLYTELRRLEVGLDRVISDV